MILISACVSGGRQTALNYFADPSFSPNPITFRWKGKPRFAWNYAVAGRGDPFFSDEEFKNFTPGQAIWYDSCDKDDFYTSRNYYPDNKTSWTNRKLETMLKETKDFFNEHAETLYDYLNGKYQIVSVDMTEFIGLSEYAKNNSKELSTWWIDTPKEIVVKDQLEKYGKENLVINDHSSSVYDNQSSRTVRALTEEEAEERYNSHRNTEELAGIHSKGNMNTLKELGVNVPFEWSGPDEIIENNGTIEELQEKLKVLYQKYTT